jgi:hypothetical protein
MRQFYHSATLRLGSAIPKNPVSHYANICGMNWRVKGIVQGLLSVIPGGTAVNDALQTSFGGLRNFEASVDDKIGNDWAVLVSHMRHLGMTVSGRDFVEVGTGWFPTLPFCYSLAGARNCKTFDIVRHLKGRFTFRMLDRLRSHLQIISDLACRSFAEVVSDYEKLKQCKTIAELLRTARVQYIAPGDATRTTLPDCSVDCLYSNSVLEHVPSAAISQIMMESHRILKPGGLSVHSANCGDHYAYFDSGISSINYLRYSERKWKLWNNALLYQNRLRPQDFAEMLEQSGLKLMLYRFAPKPHLLRQLKTMAIAPEFGRYSHEQLASTSVDLVGQKE